MCPISIPEVDVEIRASSCSRGVDILPAIVADVDAICLCCLQMSKGITVKDVSSHEFVISYAAHLKKQGKIQLPELVDLMKTGTFKELAPYNDDWFYVRCGKTISSTSQLLARGKFSFRLEAWTNIDSSRDRECSLVCPRHDALS